jgi:hypothetical protein
LPTSAEPSALQIEIRLTLASSSARPWEDDHRFHEIKYGGHLIVAVFT